MALIEATDESFDTVVQKLSELERPFRQSLQALGRLYLEYVGQPAEMERSNTLILEAYSDLLGEGLEDRVRSLIKSKSYITDKIREHAQTSHLFRQAATLVVYLAVISGPNAAKDKWPFTQEDLSLIYGDLGVNIDGY
ncbi:hypothetical protein D3C87_1187450 [compost metagenome]